MIVESCQALTSDSTCVHEAQPGKLYIKRQGTWYSIYQFTHWFTLLTVNYDIYEP